MASSPQAWRGGSAGGSTYEGDVGQPPGDLTEQAYRDTLGRLTATLSGLRPGEARTLPVEDFAPGDSAAGPELLGAVVASAAVDLRDKFLIEPLGSMVSVTRVDAPQPAEAATAARSPQSWRHKSTVQPSPSHTPSSTRGSTPTRMPGRDVPRVNVGEIADLRAGYSGRYEALLAHTLALLHDAESGHYDEASFWVQFPQNILDLAQETSGTASRDNALRWLANAVESAAASFPDYDVIFSAGGVTMRRRMIRGSTPSRIGDRQQTPYEWSPETSDYHTGFDSDVAALNAGLVSFLAGEVEFLRSRGSRSGVFHVPNEITDLGTTADLHRAVRAAQAQFPDAQLGYRANGTVQIVLIDAPPARRSPQSWRHKEMLWRRAGEASPDASAAGVPWDGRVIDEHATDVERDQARDEDVDTFDLYNPADGAKETYRVGLEAGWYALDDGVTYDGTAERNDLGDVLVWRWVVYDPDGLLTDEHGPWIVDRAEAARQGGVQAANAHQEPPHQFEAYRQGERTPRDVVLGGAPVQRSQAQVIVASSVDQADLRRVMQKLYGSDDPAVLAALTGAPDGLELYLSHAGVYKKRFSDDKPLDAVGVRVELAKEMNGVASLSRFIGVDKDGRRMMKNEIFQTTKKGEGLGLDVFSKQVEAAAQDGFDYINCHAAGYAGSGYNGFATWPKFGFDMRLDDPSIKPAERKFYRDVAKYFGVSTIQELMAAPGGRDWWCGTVKEDGTRVPGNGIDIRNATFDLDPEGVSMKVFKKYRDRKLAEKEGKKAAGPPPTPAEVTTGGAVADDNEPTRDGKPLERMPLDLTQEQADDIDAVWREIDAENAARKKPEKAAQAWRKGPPPVFDRKWAEWEGTDAYSVRRELIYDLLRDALMDAQPGTSTAVDLPPAVVADQDAYAKVVAPMLHVVLQQLYNDGLAASVAAPPPPGQRTLTLTRA